MKMETGSDGKRHEKKELFRELDKLKNKIIILRNDLNKINREKETWFHKKEDFYKKIKEKISIIKENKEKRDSLTKKVKELKEKRNFLSGETGRKISKFKKFNDEKKKLLSKSKVNDPARLKKDIENIEVKLETEVMSFEKEKKLSKTLKDIKKNLEEASEAIVIIDHTKKLSYEISENKRNTEEIHQDIQEKAKQSQKNHEEIIRISKEVDELKKKEEEAFKNFINFKAKFTSINNNLKEKLAGIGSIREKINKFVLEEEETRKLRVAMLIQSKEKEIEEKFKATKKLTTDDFLAFQETLKNR